MCTVKIKFYASQKLQKQLLLQGKDARREQQVELESKALLKHARIERDGTAIIDLQKNMPKWHVISRRKEGGKWLTMSDHERTAYVEKTHVLSQDAELDTIPSEKSVLDLLTEPDLSDEVKALQATLDEKFLKAKARVAREKAEAKERAKKQQAEAEERAKKQQAEAEERAQWIGKHGSDRLKKMLQHGYELRQTYERERAEKEYENYLFDTDEVRYNERANPSAEALAALEKHTDSSEIIWVTNDGKPSDPYDYDDETEPFEAIMIYPKWCRYRIILPV